jgi:ectoine hydroxylase-related dioxygenase (phytanoyl-CoA dioxygenase family)
MPDAPPLSPEQVARFREDGYLALPSIAPQAEVTQLRETFHRLFEGGAGWKKGAQFDLAGADDGQRPARLPQLLNPVEFAPELRETQFRANALAIARQLLGAETEPWFEHAILKPAHYGAATPWHQDEAHRDDPGTDYEQVSIWMPLQEATEANGCMRYIPESHCGPVLAHHSPNDDPRVTALECVGDFNSGRAVPCPLPPGGAAVHHCRTLHSAGPNQTDLPRFAYVLAFRGPVRPNPEFHGYPWNFEKRTAAQDRRESWQNRWGTMGRAVRGAGEAVRRKAGSVRSRLRRWIQ